MILLYFFIRLNESFIGWIVNDGWYNYNQSYYKIFYCYSFIFSALTMIILWLKMIRWIIFESIIFAQEYLNIINDENNLDEDKNDTESTIDKKMDFYGDCGIINCILMYCIGGISSLCFIYQLVDYLFILKIFIGGHFLIIMIILMAYALILNYARSIIYNIYINQFCCFNYYFNCLVFNCYHGI